MYTASTCVILLNAESSVLLVTDSAMFANPKMLNTWEWRPFLGRMSYHPRRVALLLTHVNECKWLAMTIIFFQSLSWNIGCIPDHTSQNVWNNSPLATFCCCKELRATQTTVQRNLSLKFGTVHRWIMKLVGWSRTIRAVLWSLGQPCHRASLIHLYSSLPFLHRASKRKPRLFRILWEI